MAHIPFHTLMYPQVIHIDMYDKPAAIPPVDVNYHTQLARETTGQAWRNDLQPINITQPKGPSFTVEGNMVSLQVVCSQVEVHQGAAWWGLVQVQVQVGFGAGWDTVESAIWN
jgi:Cu2+-containing amine oxidase